MTAVYEYGPRTDFYQGGSALEGESLRDEVERLRPLAELGRMTATVAHEVRIHWLVLVLTPSYCAKSWLTRWIKIVLM